MSAIGTILGFLGTIAEIAYPPAAPFIAFALRVEPIAEASVPLLKDGITGGPDAFAAFKAKAPDFYKHLQGLATALKAGPGASTAGVTVSDHEVVTLGAHIVGIDPPGWTHEATQRWWDRGLGAQGG